MSIPLAFTVVLSQFSALRMQANDEWHAVKAITVGTSIAMTGPELVRASEMANGAPLSCALRQFVKGLPDEQLYALLALIYAGRDGRPDPVAYWHSNIKATVQSRSAAVEVILEKEPAAEYLRRAVDSLAEGIELDLIPTQLSRPT